MKTTRICMLLLGAAAALALASCGDNEGEPSPAADAGLVADSGATQQDGAQAVDQKVDPDTGNPASGNQTCARAKKLALSGGKVSVSGDILGAANEFGAKIGCGDAMGPWKGGQRYYRVSLAAGKTYKVTLTPVSGDMAIYAFPASTACTSSAINAACKGHSRDVPDSPGNPGKAEAMLLTPAKSGEWIVVADSYSAFLKSKFTLAIEEFSAPANRTCTGAKKLATPAGGPVTVTGGTIGATNQYSTITCGQSQGGKPVAFLGPQLYYKVILEGGTRYRFNLRANFFARMYLFSAVAGCSASGIQAGCSSKGSAGAATSVAMDASTDLYFKPTTGGTYYLAVDSLKPVIYGTFTLSLNEYKVTGFTAPLKLSFDSGCGGLAATGDWECGKLAFKAGSACKLGSKTFGVAPTKGHSGHGVWGTKLNDCYSGLGNNSKVDEKKGTCANSNPADDSILKLKVSIPAKWTKATMTYWSWEDLNSPYDWGEVRVGHKPVNQLCSKSYTKPTAWVKRTVDLSAHTGKTVEIGFHFMASQWVNYAGWYIDDLAISGQ